LPAHAQERAPVTWDATFDNDKWGDGADRHYTAGTRLTRRSDAVPSWIRKIFSPLHCLACTAPTGLEVELGQEIYTPEETWKRTLVTDDRPYAGWAYGALTVVGEREAANGRRKAMNTMTLELGVVGPASLAERTQELMHREKELYAVNGWEHQLQNEVGAVLTYQRGFRQLLGRESAPVRHDLTPYFEGALGNVRTHVGGGLKWRSGRNLDTSSIVAQRGWRLFADLNVRAVGRNTLLDGNADGASHSVPKEPVVASVAAGFEYRGQRFGLSLSRERRSREFVGQREPDEYGSIAFSFNP
jgi:hypothetical protein